MNSRSATRIDEHVGNRLRMRRILVGMSQEKLGEKLGLTFQQIQKYERATNRISASRLFEIARILDVPVSFFYEGLEAEQSENAFTEEGSTFIADAMSSPEGLRLHRAFLQIHDQAVQKRLLDLVVALAQRETDS